MRADLFCWDGLYTKGKLKTKQTVRNHNFRTLSYSSHSTSAGIIDNDCHRILHNPPLGNTNIQLYAEINQTSVNGGEYGSTGVGFGFSKGF